MTSPAGCIWLGRSEPGYWECGDEMEDDMAEQQACDLLGCKRRTWHRGHCSTTPDVEPAKRVSCCQHFNHSSATVHDVKHRVCRDCGTRWQEFPLTVNWV